MKKLLLSVFGILSSFAFSAQAVEVGEEFTIGDITYEVLTPTTVSLSSIKSAVTTVDLTSTVTYEGTDYALTEIGRDAFYWSKVANVVIPDGVTAIGYGAFRSSSLANVTIPTSVRTIGDYAFSSTKLTSIDIPEGVESIGGSCFFTCNSLTEINLPSTLKSIGLSCFYKVPMEEITLPEGLTNLADKAFLRCGKLKSLTIPAGVTTIGAGLANYCESLTSVTLHDGITSIGDEAFSVTALSGAFTFPAALESIGEGAFSKTAITEFVLPAGSKLYKDGEAIYSGDKSLLLAFPPKAANTTVKVLSECVGIGEGAFWSTNVTKVELGSKIRAIGEYAFVTSELAEINLPNSIVFIGEQAFAGTKLPSVVLPANLPEIQDAAFAQCPSLASVTIPASVNYIDIRAFTGCSALANVYCQGAVPPALEEVYESYEEQFYQIASNSTLHIPAGTADAYKKAGWSSAFKNVAEDMPAIAEVISFDPANDSFLAKFDGVSIEFASTPSVEKQFPELLVQQGPLVAGTPNGKVISVTGWRAIISDGKGRIYPEDYDGYTEPFNLEDGKDYYITIPQGVFKTADGAINDRIVLHYVGQEPKFEPIEFDPADGAKISSFDGVKITFAEKVTLVSSTYQGTKLLKGTYEDGKVTGTQVTNYDFEEWRTTSMSNGTAIRLWPADMDYFVAPFYLDTTSDYYLVIPAKSFRNNDWVYSQEIILHYSNKTEGIYSVGSADDYQISIEAANGAITVDADTADIYTTAGVKIATINGKDSVNLPAGVYIVAAKKGTAFKNAKVIL